MKKNHKPVFICELPPPYGGVTVKNQLIIDEIFSPGDFEIIDLCDCKTNIFNIFPVLYRIIKAFITHQTIIYGFGSYFRLRMVIYLQNLFGGKQSLKNTINIVMGGTFQNYVIRKKIFIKSLSQMKIHYVETYGMKYGLLKQNIKNVNIFPNARSMSRSIQPQIINYSEKKLRCVFFSQISTNKGVREIIKMYSLLDDNERSNIFIDFYGHILDEIKNTFNTFIESNKNVNYLGVFDSARGDVYAKLNEYDVLLFPTLWKFEGIPGILVEAKMAGIVPVVSDICFNPEIVKDGIDGIVSHEKYYLALKDTLQLLLNDKNKLQDLKNGSYESRTHYAIETYVDEMRKTIYS